MGAQALGRNNTPPMAQEGPSGLCRWEEAWATLHHSEASGVVIMR